MSASEPDFYFVYCMVEEDSPQGPCKVGVAGNLTARLSQLQCGNWRPLKLAWSVKIKDRRNALNIEFRILSWWRPSMFSDDSRGVRRLKSEWIDTSPEQAYEAGRMLYEIYIEEEAA